MVLTPPRCPQKGAKGAGVRGGCEGGREAAGGERERGGGSSGNFCGGVSVLCHRVCSRAQTMGGVFVDVDATVATLLTKGFAPGLLQTSSALSKLH